MTKDELQHKACVLMEQHQHVCLEWATGTGKTLAALKMKDVVNTGNALLVCKESTHLDSWMAEMDKHNYPAMDRMLYASLHKLDRQYDLIILDEVHALTWKRVDALRKWIAGGARVIALSATLNPDKKYLLETLCGDVKYAKVTLASAIKHKLLPAPTIHVSYITMKDEDRRKYMNIERQMAYFEFSKNYQSQKITGLKRKKFTASVKTEAAISIVEKFRRDKTRFLCFSADIKQAQDVSKGAVICSNVSKKENARMISAFNNEELDELFAVKMLREAVNLTEIENGLIIQLDSKALSFYQMLGRCLRHHTPQMHMIIVRDSQDERNFLKITNDIKEYIVEHDIEL